MLQGRTIALTEGRRAAELARLVEKLGGVPYPAPAVREVPRTDLGPATAVLGAIVRGEVAVIVFLTGVGTRAYFALAEPQVVTPALLDRLGQMLVVARGPKPAAVRRGAGARPPGEPASGGGLAALGSHDLAGKSVAVQLYGDDHVAVSDALAGRGARVLDIPLYEWAFPEDETVLERFVADACAGRIDVVAFTSSPQIRHVFAVAERLGRARELTRALDASVTTAVVGPVCAASLVERGITPKIVAPKGTMGALVHAIAESLS